MVARDHFFISSAFGQCALYISVKAIVQEPENVKESCFAASVFSKEHSHAGKITCLGVLEDFIILDFY